jgi:hypothetical protein
LSRELSPNRAAQPFALAGPRHTYGREGLVECLIRRQHLTGGDDTHNGPNHSDEELVAPLGVEIPKLPVPLYPKTMNAVGVLTIIVGGIIATASIANLGQPWTRKP